MIDLAPESTPVKVFSDSLEGNTSVKIVNGTMEGSSLMTEKSSLSVSNL